MMKMMNKVFANGHVVPAAGAITLACLLSAGSAQALTTFTAGTAAKAAEVNDNFTELAGRISGLEDKHTAMTVNVDCATDPTALQTALSTQSSGNTYTITGTCTGPITADRHNLTLKAATAGVDGISAPGVGDPVLTVQARHIKVEGLLLNATVADSSTGLMVYRNGSAKVDNLFVTGAQWDFVVGGAGAARVFNTTNIAVLNAVNAGAVRIESGNGGFKLGAYRNGTIEIRPSASGSEFTRINAGDGGQVTVRGNTTAITVNGKVDIWRNSSANFDGPLTLTYHNANDDEDAGLLAIENSSIRLNNGGTINAYTEAAGNSAIRVSGTTFVDPTPGSNQNGSIYVGVNAAFVMHSNSTAGYIEIEESSSAVIEHSTLSGVTPPWDSNRTIALEAQSSSSVTLEDSTISDDVELRSGSTLDLEDSTLNGNLVAMQNANIDVDNSTINATRASGGTCPANWNEGILLDSGSNLTTQGTPSISAYIQYGRYSTLSTYNISDWGGTVDMQDWARDQLANNDGGSITGINICTPAP